LITYCIYCSSANHLFEFLDTTIPFSPTTTTTITTTTITTTTITTTITTTTTTTMAVHWKELVIHDIERCCRSKVINNPNVSSGANNYVS
jgi:hypothetical protein